MSSRKETVKSAITMLNITLVTLALYSFQYPIRAEGKTLPECDLADEHKCEEFFRALVQSGARGDEISRLAQEIAHGTKRDGGPHVLG
jgi:hypothetical protein